MPNANAFLLLLIENDGRRRGNALNRESNVRSSGAE